MTEQQRWNAALDLFIESLMEPDPQLRATAHELECHTELMAIREQQIEHCRSMHWK